MKEIELPKDLTLPKNDTLVEFPDKKQVIFDSKRHFENIIEQQKLRKEGDCSQNSCEVDLRTTQRYILVVGSSDWHLGSENTDYKMFQRHMKIIKETEGVYMVVVGDERDNFVNPKLRTGLFEGVLNPQQQAEMQLGILMDMNEKILARAGGNHDGWTWFQSGISVENYWQNDMNSPLMRNGGFMHFKVNDVEYLGYLHHGLSKFNSSFNPNHASRRAFEFQGPYDFMFSGHVHQTEVAHGYRWADEYHKDTVMVRTGTYKVDDQYARALQLGRGQAPGACILFDTEQKRMLPFVRLEDGVEAMEAMNTYKYLAAQGFLGIK